MNKNIYAFLIPFILLLIVAFTPILDKPLANFKNKVNLVGHKTLKYIADYNNTVEKMRGDLILFRDKYEAYVVENFGDNSEVMTYMMNYFYLYNERNIAFLENNRIAKGSEYNETDMINLMGEFDKKANIQYKCAKKIFKRGDISPVDFYKSMSDENNLIAKYAWTYIYDKDLKTGFDDNTTCVAEKLF